MTPRTLEALDQFLVAVDQLASEVCPPHSYARELIYEKGQALHKALEEEKEDAPKPSWHDRTPPGQLINTNPGLIE